MVSDGTAEGTNQVVPGSFGDLFEFNESLYFHGWLFFEVDGFWRSEGTLEATEPASFDGFGRQTPIVLDELLYYRCSCNDGVWLARTDGKNHEILEVDLTYRPEMVATGSHIFASGSRSTLIAIDLLSLSVTDLGLEVEGMAATDNGLYFQNNNQLWITKGTASTTRRIADGPLDFENAFVVEDDLFAAGYDGRFFSSRGKLYRINESEITALQSTNYWSFNADFPSFDEFTQVGDAVYYRHDDQIWKIDEAFENVSRVDGAYPRSIRRSHETYSDSVLVELDGKLIFSGVDPENGIELWIIDELGNARLLKDINPGVKSSQPGEFFAANGILYFSADDGENGRELWRTNGTREGTFMLEDLRMGKRELTTPVDFPSRIRTDFDADGDTDTADRTIQVVEWTGALPHGVGDRKWYGGDTDDDGDVDTLDQNRLIRELHGYAAKSISGNAQDVDLVFASVQEPTSADASVATDEPFGSFFLA